MSQYANLTEKEQILGKLATPNLVRDSNTGNYGSEHRFPFVFAMPMQFYTQAEAIAYLKAMSSEPSDNEENLHERANRIWHNWQPIYDEQIQNKYERQFQSKEEQKINSSKYYSDAKYSDALLPDRTSNLTENDASALGLDPIYTRPNQSTTEIGGNDAINCYWQFNWDDDLVPPMLSAHMSQVSPITGGLGRVYSEMINSNQQLLCISVGVPKYARLLRFYSNLFNSAASVVFISFSSISDGRLSGLYIFSIGYHHTGPFPLFP